MKSTAHAKNRLDAIQNFALCSLAIVLLTSCASPSELERSMRHNVSYPALPAENEVSLTWLGTTGFVLRHKDSTILIDPFLSRPKRLPVILNRPLEPNAGLLRKRIPNADYIFVSHSHYDHSMDAPMLSIQTGAKLVGSPSMLNMARGYHVPESHLENAWNYDGDAGDFKVKVFPNDHPKLCQYFCRRIYNEGVIMHPPASTHYTMSEMKLGHTFSYLFSVGGGFKIYHHGSAGLLTDQIRKVGKVDVLILGVALWDKNDHYIEKMLELTRPGLLIPTHHDSFFGAFPDDPHQVNVSGTSDFEKFIKTVQTVRPDLPIKTLGYLRELRLRVD